MAAAPLFRNIGEQILTRFKTNIRETPFREEVTPGLDMQVRLVSAPAPVLAAASDETEEPDIPDFRGMTIREVLKKAREKGMDVRIVGSGWAIAQKPAAGVPVPENRLCTVTFGKGS